MNTAPRYIVPAGFRFFAPAAIAAPCAALLLSCAGQVYPTGGPVDRVPPAIVRTEPDTNALHVQTQSITLEFSKYVDRRSVEESVFITPYVGDLEFDWSATEVTCRFNQPLKGNTTYVVNVGTDVADLHAGNRMAAGFTLAFSTGDSIDKGFVSGRVYDEKPEGVMIFAYALSGISGDTLNPEHTKPEYIMQTGRGGMWTLSNIAFGTYRIFAVRDEYRNFVYDRGTDAYGATTGDITVDAAHPRVKDVNFRLTKEDTVKPFLTLVQAANRTTLRVRFSESIDSLTFPTAVFSVTDTLKGTSVRPALWWLNRASPASAGILLASPLDSGVTYRLSAAGVYDPAGNPIDTSHARFEFIGTGRPDTVKPVLSVVGMRDSVRGVWIDQPVEIDFSKPVIHDPLNTAVELLDSTRKRVDVSMKWLNATDLVLVPRKDYLSRAWYVIRVQMDSVRDYAGNRCKDSTLQLRFQTFDLRSTGVIAGEVIDRQSDSTGGVLVLTASSIDLTPQRKRTLSLRRPGPFLLDRLVEGKYVLDLYRDRDSSGSYSFGKVHPFAPAERFAVYPDTVKVRARWSVEGVQIVLP